MEKDLKDRFYNAALILFFCVYSLCIWLVRIKNKGAFQGEEELKGFNNQVAAGGQLPFVLPRQQELRPLSAPCLEAAAIVLRFLLGILIEIISRRKRKRPFIHHQRTQTMTNDGGCGIIRASRPCFSVQGVIAGDNSFSIIHIAPTLCWEYCHTATICLDLISWRSDGDGAWAERRAAGWRAGEKKDVRRWNLGGKRGRNGKLKERKAWKSRFACKLCKHSSNSVCRRVLAECFRNSTSMISTYCVWSVFVPTSVCEIFIYRLRLWRIGMWLHLPVGIRCFIFVCIPASCSRVRQSSD